MDTLIQGATLVALTCVSALCIYLIVVLRKIKTVLELLHTELAELSQRLKPLLENLTIASEKFRSVASKIDDQVTMVHGVFVSLRKIVNNVQLFEERILNILEEPFRSVSSVFSTILKYLGFIFGKR
ncbi:MAG: hypothetical protein N3A63_04715 [Bacteroidetes bacterium]|nr:hypothetical protein [Bacteroidota bacterium]